MNYWLMKSEPECFSIDDLERLKTTMWEGCRNYQVRNRFRDEFQVGDLAFFYHSGSNPPGIVGIMRVISAAYPDPTQFQPESDYFDPSSDPKNPRWLLVDVEFQSKLKQTISLNQLKATPGLESMEVTRKGQRLSVLRVTPEEWKTVLTLS